MSQSTSHIVGALLRVAIPIQRLWTLSLHLLYLQLSLYLPFPLLLDLCHQRQQHRRNLLHPFNVLPHAIPPSNGVCASLARPHNQYPRNHPSSRIGRHYLMTRNIFRDLLQQMVHCQVARFRPLRLRSRRGSPCIRTTQASCKSRRLQLHSRHHHNGRCLLPQSNFQSSPPCLLHHDVVRNSFLFSK